MPGAANKCGATHNACVASSAFFGAYFIYRHERVPLYFWSHGSVFLAINGPHSRAGSCSRTGDSRDSRDSRDRGTGGGYGGSGTQCSGHAEDRPELRVHGLP
jgi:hypothetical protein